MKITVIKKSNGKVKTMAGCPWILDELRPRPKTEGGRLHWRNCAHGR